MLFLVYVGLHHFFLREAKKIERNFVEVREGYYPSVKMTSTELSTWLLGIGGYAGLFGSLATFYIYPNFPRNYLPVLFITPVLSAGALYAFFQVLYVVLRFSVMVLQAMLDEQITIVLLSTTFIGGQAVLVGYVLYNYGFKKHDTPVADEQHELEAEDYEEANDTEGEDAEEGEEGEEDEDENEDNGADADNEEGAPLLSSIPPPTPITPLTPATPAPAAPPMCVDCDNDCTKCMPPLMSLNATTGLSGEVICEDGICRIGRADVGWGIEHGDRWEGVPDEEVKI